MTLGTAVRQAWELLGEPDDLNPSKTGTKKLIDAINDAQDMVAMWIDARGHKVPFRELDDIITFSTIVLTDTLGAQGSQQILDLPAGITGGLGRFDDWFITVGLETKRIVTSTIVGGLHRITLSSAFAQDVSGLTFILAKKTYLFTGLDAIETDMRVVEIQRVFDTEQEIQLTESAGRDFLYQEVSGVPGLWRHRRAGIEFDVAPDQVYSYQLHVVRMPTRVKEQVDSLELPDVFCQAVILKTVQWGFRRMQDFQAAYATKRDFVELMVSLANSIGMNEEPDYFKVRSR